MTRRVISKIEREAIIKVWHSKCAYCRKKQDKFDIDHIEPYSKGGSCDLSNLVPACNKCNSTKANLVIPDEYKGILIAKAAIKKERIEKLIKAAEHKKVKPKHTEYKRNPFHCIDIPYTCDLFYTDWDYVGPVELYEPTEGVLQYLDLIYLNIKTKEVKRECLNEPYTIETSTIPLHLIKTKDYKLGRLSLNKKIPNGWGLHSCKVINKYIKNEDTIHVELGEDFNYVYGVVKANAEH